jgi:hypothetical protein
MKRSRRMIPPLVGAVAGTAGLVVCTVVLARQGLDRAEKWVSVVGVVLSVLIAAAGLWFTWRTAAPETDPPVSAGAAGAVAVGGRNSARVATKVSGGSPAATTGPGGGVSAAGPGAVAVGRDNTAPIETDVTGPGIDRS